MDTFHQEVVNQLGILDERRKRLRREMRAGFAELRQILTDHMVVGDAADGQFATRLDDHEKRIRTLEGR
jgi:hypothetical protein